MAEFSYNTGRPLFTILFLFVTHHCNTHTITWEDSVQTLEKYSQARYNKKYHGFIWCEKLMERRYFS